LANGNSFKAAVYYELRAVTVSQSEPRGMVKVTYIQRDCVEHTIEVLVGASVMEGAVKNGIDGIDGECGGAYACGTCHICVDDIGLGKVGTKSASEESMLEFVEGAAPHSRLSCQIPVTAELDGLVVRIPRSQHGQTGVQAGRSFFIARRTVFFTLVPRAAHDDANSQCTVLANVTGNAATPRTTSLD